MASKKKSADIFSSPDVYQPQGPSTLSNPLFEDARGFIRRIDTQGQKLNLLFTKKGFMRSGDLHKIAQYDFIFSGQIEIWYRIDGKDVKKVYGAHEFLEIPPGVPHLFNFVEDTLMAEWWDGPFETWYFRPYRDIIEGKAPLSRLGAR